MKKSSVTERYGTNSVSMVKLDNFPGTGKKTCRKNYQNSQNTHLAFKFQMSSHRLKLIFRTKKNSKKFMPGCLLLYYSYHCGGRSNYEKNFKKAKYFSQCSCFKKPLIRFLLWYKKQSPKKLVFCVWYWGCIACVWHTRTFVSNCFGLFLMATFAVFSPE
jgi:hypothetical protein